MRDPSDARRIRSLMRHHAYRDDSKLTVRHRLHSFVSGPLPSPRGRIFAALEPRGNETVVDVGCGNGQDLRVLFAAGHTGRLIGLDISTGMLRRITLPQISVICADAARLPLASAVGDIVLAMSMLYHVAELNEALQELRRVLRPGGTFVASASSAQNMPEFVDVWDEATIDVVGRDVGLRKSWARTFNTESGEHILRRVFDSVDVRHFEWALDPPDPRSVREYAESTRDLYANIFPRDVWGAVMDRLESLVGARFDADGGFPIRVRKGIFIAT